MVFIYGLFDPRNLELRYIGRTKHSTNIRISQHIHEAKGSSNTHKSRWINQLLLDGLKPSAEILEECTEDNWSEIEQAWIAECKKFGLNLVNGTNGGDGLRVDSLTPEHREKIRIANTGKKYPKRPRSEARVEWAREHMKGNTYRQGMKWSEEMKELFAERSRGKKLSKEAKQKVSESKKGKPRSEETKQKLREANLGKKASDEAKKKMSETRRNMSDETKKKLSIASKGNNRALGHVHSEETRKQISEASLKSWVKRKARKNED